MSAGMLCTESTRQCRLVFSLVEVVESEGLHRPGTMVLLSYDGESIKIKTTNSSKVRSFIFQEESVAVARLSAVAPGSDMWISFSDVSIAREQSLCAILRTREQSLCAREQSIEDPSLCLDREKDSGCRWHDESFR